MGAYLSSPDVTKYTTSGACGSLNIKWSVCSMQGWRVGMEDTHLVLYAKTFPRPGARGARRLSASSFLARSSSSSASFPSGGGSSSSSSASFSPLQQPLETACSSPALFSATAGAGAGPAAAADRAAWTGAGGGGGAGSCSSSFSDAAVAASPFAGRTAGVPAEAYVSSPNVGGARETAASPSPVGAVLQAETQQQQHLCHAPTGLGGVTGSLLRAGAAQEAAPAPAALTGPAAGGAAGGREGGGGVNESSAEGAAAALGLAPLLPSAEFLRDEWALRSNSSSVTGAVGGGGGGGAIVESGRWAAPGIRNLPGSAGSLTACLPVMPDEELYFQWGETVMYKRKRSLPPLCCSSNTNSASCFQSPPLGPANPCSSGYGDGAATGAAAQQQQQYARAEAGGKPAAGAGALHTAAAGGTGGAATAAATAPLGIEGERPAAAAAGSSSGGSRWGFRRRRRSSAGGAGGPHVGDETETAPTEAEAADADPEQLLGEDAFLSVELGDVKLALFAVFDGHGGPHVARFAAQHLPAELLRQEGFRKGHFAAALRGAYIAVDELLRSSEKAQEELNFYLNHPTPHMQRLEEQAAALAAAASAAAASASAAPAPASSACTAGAAAAYPPPTYVQDPSGAVAAVPTAAAAPPSAPPPPPGLSPFPPGAAGAASAASPAAAAGGVLQPLPARSPCGSATTHTGSSGSSTGDSSSTSSSGDGSSGNGRSEADGRSSRRGSRSSNSSSSCRGNSSRSEKDASDTPHTDGAAERGGREGGTSETAVGARGDAVGDARQQQPQSGTSSSSSIQNSCTGLPPADRSSSCFPSSRAAAAAGDAAAAPATSSGSAATVSQGLGGGATAAEGRTASEAAVTVGVASGIPSPNGSCTTAAEDERSEEATAAPLRSRGTEDTTGSRGEAAARSVGLSLEAAAAGGGQQGSYGVGRLRPGAEGSSSSAVAHDPAATSTGSAAAACPSAAAAAEQRQEHREPESGGHSFSRASSASDYFVPKPKTNSSGRRGSSNSSGDSSSEKAEQAVPRQSAAAEPGPAAAAAPRPAAAGAAAATLSPSSGPAAAAAASSATAAGTYSSPTAGVAVGPGRTAATAERSPGRREDSEAYMQRSSPPDGMDIPRESDDNLRLSSSALAAAGAAEPDFSSCSSSSFSSPPAFSPCVPVPLRAGGPPRLVLPPGVAIASSGLPEQGMPEPWKIAARERNDSGSSGSGIAAGGGGGFFHRGSGGGSCFPSGAVGAAGGTPAAHSSSNAPGRRGSLRSALQNIYDGLRSSLNIGKFFSRAVAGVAGGAGPVRSLASLSGCTAITVLVTPTAVVVANVGDSRCVLCRGEEALELSKDHKPQLPEERIRIYGAGGYLEMGRVNGNLNLSRALGDLVYKQDSGLPPERQIVSAVPDVVTVSRDPDRDDFLLIGCDGIWEFLSSQVIVDFVRRRLRRTTDLGRVLQELFDHLLSPNPALVEYGCDNMTAILVDLRPRARAVVCSVPPSLSVAESGGGAAAFCSSAAPDAAGAMYSESDNRRPGSSPWAAGPSTAPETPHPATPALHVHGTAAAVGSEGDTHAAAVVRAASRPLPGDGVASIAAVPADQVSSAAVPAGRQTAASTAPPAAAETSAAATPHTALDTAAAAMPTAASPASAATAAASETSALTSPSAAARSQTSAASPNAAALDAPARALTAAAAAGTAAALAASAAADPFVTAVAAPGKSGDGELGAAPSPVARTGKADVTSFSHVETPYTPLPHEETHGDTSQSSSMFARTAAVAQAAEALVKQGGCARRTTVGFADRAAASPAAGSERSSSSDRAAAAAAAPEVRQPQQQGKIFSTPSGAPIESQVASQQAAVTDAHGGSHVDSGTDEKADDVLKTEEEGRVPLLTAQVTLTPTEVGSQTGDTAPTPRRQ